MNYMRHVQEILEICIQQVAEVDNIDARFVAKLRQQLAAQSLASHSAPQKALAVIEGEQNEPETTDATS